MDQLVVWAIVSPGGWPEPWGLGQHLGCFAGWGGEAGTGEEEGYRDGCRPKLGRAWCQGLSGTHSFLGACSAPSWGPSRVQGCMVSARQVHLPHYLCPTHASTLLSPAPSAPYGNDLLLPDLADTHGSPSAYATTASVSSVLFQDNTNWNSEVRDKYIHISLEYQITLTVSRCPCNTARHNKCFLTMAVLFSFVVTEL